MSRDREYLVEVNGRWYKADPQTGRTWLCWRCDNMIPEHRIANQFCSRECEDYFDEFGR